MPGQTEKFVLKDDCEKKHVAVSRANSRLWWVWGIFLPVFCTVIGAVIALACTALADAHNISVEFKTYAAGQDQVTKNVEESLERIDGRLEKIDERLLKVIHGGRTTFEGKGE